MNNGELKAKLYNFAHRTGDPNLPVQQFINAATEMVNLRFDQRFSRMSQDSDSNVLLAEHGETIYWYAAMFHLSLYIKDLDEAEVFKVQFERAAARVDITGSVPNMSTNPNTLTHVRTEAESAALQED